ncbi:ABC transporter substrate-binding protein [Paenibacillus sp.]|uniref:ABC transporter substrate-binding protein n=1 Tax=Paenibacillus sp. TaxID=58172 RepID=UPI002D425040|nr:extracellular solute-binding protein [Paenibacillus sp.]HZG85945.1 extracellular solute-binding protein [Paenibacillus sp.]
MRSTKKNAASLLVSGAMLISLLAACSGGAEPASKEDGSASEGAAAATTSETATEAAAKEEAAPEPVTISLLTDNTQDAVNGAKALIEAFQAKYPHITVEHETRPQGAEGDNFVKTRLATGDMNDVFFYNSGSLMQALNPEQNMVDLTNEPFQANVIDSFKPTVTFNGKVYGAPVGSTMGGGWFYNKKIYADLGLSIPKTWAELMENNDKIKAAGLTPIIGSYKETWTSQLIMLADYYNVQAQVPNFAADYTANKAKYATTPAALRSFQKLEETVGYMNKDFLATTYDGGLKMLAEGQGAHYPMLTFAVPALVQNNPEQIDNIGFFAQPGDSADQNGLTVWMPGAAYIYKNGQHIEEAKKFVEFVASVEGIAAMSQVSKPSGPYVVKGAEMPEDTPQVILDMLPYFENNMTAPALEFLSPIKGPNLEHFTVEVGSGLRSAEDAAAAYDKDVEKQAQQLGLEGW